MPVYKDSSHPGQWRVVYRYTDWTGERKQTQKRGFKTKREAAEWEREQLRQKNADLDMTFESFAELYEADMKPRLKANTWRTKETILKKKLIPYFGKRRMCDITSHDTIQRAIRIGTYFLAHASYAYSLLGCDVNMKKARFVLNKILKERITTVKRWELFSKCRCKYFKEKDDILPTLELLEANGYIRIEENTGKPGAGR